MMDYINPFRSNSGSYSIKNLTEFGDAEVLAADRKPCPVCGHPTGDCTGGGEGIPIGLLPTQLSGLEPMILVEQDVTEERMITPYTRARVLIHRKGSYIPLSEARKLGLAD
jgi:hypothetical protein